VAFLQTTIKNAFSHLHTCNDSINIMGQVKVTKWVKTNNSSLNDKISYACMYISSESKLKSNFPYLGRYLYIVFLFLNCYNSSEHETWFHFYLKIEKKKINPTLDTAIWPACTYNLINVWQESLLESILKNRHLLQKQMDRRLRVNLHICKAGHDFISIKWQWTKNISNKIKIK